MSYRKLTVDGVDYRYVIGKTHTKVQRIGQASFDVYVNAVIGHKIYSHINKYLVTPKDVVNAIQGEAVTAYVCSKHNVTTTEVTCNPYAAEIEGRIRYMINCRDCVNDVAAEI